MRYLKCNYVNLSTGPDMPSVDGLQFKFANESQYPTPAPLLYCTAPGGVDVNVPGVLTELTAQEFEAASAAELAGRKLQLQERATAARWQAGEVGIDFAGARIRATVDDLVRTTSAAGRPGKVFDYKAIGGWLTLTAEQLQAAQAAINAHVQRCFAVERAHHEAIAQLPDFAAVAAYDVSTGWPDQEPAAE